MNNSNDIKDLCRQIRKAYHDGSEISIDSVRRIKDWLNSKDKEEYSPKDWELKCICWELECKHFKTICKNWQTDYEVLESLYGSLEYRVKIYEDKIDLLNKKLEKNGKNRKK